MQKLAVFKNHFVAALQGLCRDNLVRYQSDEPWTSEIPIQGGRSIEGAYELSAPLDLDFPQGKDLKDLENSIKMHQAFPNLTPLQASDPRLWVHLTHVELWKYMRARWTVESSKGNREDYVRRHYFVPRQESRALTRNGAARLWWAAYLTYDRKRDNPYELTAVILFNLDITQQTLERAFGRAPTVLHSFLEFLLRNKEILLTGGDINRARIRMLAKHVNLCGGATLLDSLSQSELIAMLEAEFDRIKGVEDQSA